jgi:hypothetical protein
MVSRYCSIRRSCPGPVHKGIHLSSRFGRHFVSTASEDDLGGPGRMRYWAVQKVSRVAVERGDGTYRYM